MRVLVCGGSKRKQLLMRMAAALHRAELREKSYDDPPKFVHLPEWAQSTYLKRADAALRVVEAVSRRSPASPDARG